MNAKIVGNFAVVWLPTVDFEKGVYEYYILPTFIFTNNKEKKYRAITLHWWKWALISVIKTV